MRKRLLLLFWCLLLVVSGSEATPPGRGTPGVRQKATTSQTINPDTLYSASYALVIGASAYQSSGWPKLRGVLDDVTAVQAALEQQGFQVTTLLDPDRTALLKAFDDFIRLHGLSENNRLLFYFAGHGYTDKTYWGETIGYIVPIDAPNPLEDLNGFLSVGVNMQLIEVYSKNIRSKHALFVFDSCFSGSIFARSRAAVPPAITYKTALPVRQFLTSGSANELVPDYSMFRQQFVSGLAGKADTNGDGYITGTELGMFLEDKVVNYSRNAQHPQFGTIRSPGLDEGDFVFQVAEVAQPTQPTLHSEAKPESVTAVVRPKSVASQAINLDTLYSASYALVIGASDYTNGWPRLPSVKTDVSEVKSVLRTHGFTVTTVLNPTKSELFQAFDDFIRQHGRKPDNRLLFYFAVHGYTAKKSYGDYMGYIVPVDAPNPLQDLDGVLNFGLDMQQIEVYAKRIEAKHALFVFDSCLSFSNFSLSRSAVSQGITYKTALPVRQFIASCSTQEQMPDPSIFRKQFVSALDGEADSNSDGYITGTELGIFLQDTVINYSRDNQHPEFGNIRDPNLDRGDFVFQVIAGQ